MNVTYSSAMAKQRSTLPKTERTLHKMFESMQAGAAGALNFRDFSRIARFRLATADLRIKKRNLTAKNSV